MFTLVWQTMIAETWHSAGPWRQEAASFRKAAYTGTFWAPCWIVLKHNRSCFGYCANSGFRCSCLQKVHHECKHIKKHLCIIPLVSARCNTHHLASLNFDNRRNVCCQNNSKMSISVSRLAEHICIHYVGQLRYLFVLQRGKLLFHRPLLWRSQRSSLISAVLFIFASDDARSSCHSPRQRCTSCCSLCSYVYSEITAQAKSQTQTPFRCCGPC